MSHETGTQPLGVLPSVDLRPAQVRTLRVLETYDLGPIRHRLQTKALLLPGLIDEALLEFRRYLALHALLDAAVTIYSQAVDDVWHTSIMFTQRYAELCELAFGRHIPHRPDRGHEYAVRHASDGARRRFAEFQADYEWYFGPISPLWLVDRPWATSPRG